MGEEDVCMRAHAYNSSPQETMTELWVQGQPGYIVRTCLN